MSNHMAGIAEGHITRRVLLAVSMEGPVMMVIHPGTAE
jgi:hypothetical protein